MKTLEIICNNTDAIETFENVSSTYVENEFFNIKQVLGKEVVITSIPVGLITRAVLSREKR